MSKNPFAQMKQPIQLSVKGSNEMLAAIEFAVEEEVLTLTRLLKDAQIQHRGITPESHEREAVELQLLVDEAKITFMRGMIESAGAPFGTPQITQVKLAQIDWVSKVQKDFPAFTVGPFYVHGSHAQGAAPRNHFPLLIDAAAAFGTGEHATTAGCLLALANVKKKRPSMPVVVDVGAGTAILAIGAARLWKNARLIACDYDPIAVEVSAHNLKVNRVGQRSTTFVSDGYKAQKIRGLYPLIVANILAKPLMKMARDAARHLAPGGTLILSGLLNSQEAMVLSAHRAQGLYLSTRMRRGAWSILVLRKGR